MKYSNASVKPVALVVEDEPIQRMVAVDLAEEAGYAVIDAPNADRALELLETNNVIDILFTDIDMPGSINGLELVATVQDRFPETKIIIVSGHHRERDLSIPNGSHFFSKPYNFEHLGLVLTEFKTQLC